jgi:hypothetical protein
MDIVTTRDQRKTTEQRYIPDMEQPNPTPGHSHCRFMQKSPEGLGLISDIEIEIGVGLLHLYLYE